MELEQYQLQATVKGEDGARHNVIVHVHPNGATFAGTAGVPEPSLLSLDPAPVLAVCEAVIEGHSIAENDGHLPDPDPPATET
jgi:hypothetical protein